MLCVQYGIHEGTSQSAGFVAGAAALLLAAYRQAGYNASGAMMKDPLMRGVNPSPGLSTKCSSGECCPFLWSNTATGVTEFLDDHEGTCAQESMKTMMHCVVEVMRMRWQTPLGGLLWDRGHAGHRALHDTGAAQPRDAGGGLCSCSKQSSPGDNQCQRRHGLSCVSGYQEIAQVSGFQMHDQRRA
jgi:hypothetical protein